MTSDPSAYPLKLTKAVHLLHLPIFFGAPTVRARGSDSASIWLMQAIFRQPVLLEAGDYRCAHAHFHVWWQPPSRNSRFLPGRPSSSNPKWPLFVFVLELRCFNKRCIWRVNEGDSALNPSHHTFFGPDAINNKRHPCSNVSALTTQSDLLSYLSWISFMWQTEYFDNSMG